MLDARERNKLMVANRKVIHNAAKRFAQNYHYDAEEAVAEAYLIFLKVHDKYDKTKGMSFSTWVYFKVYKSLISHLRKLLRQRRWLGERVAMEMRELVSKDVPVSIDDIRGCASKDAKTLIDIALDWPNEFLLMIKPKDTDTAIRLRLKQYVHKHLNWDTDRINRGFAEVRSIIE